MNKILSILLILILVLSGCSNSPELVTINGREVMESQYQNEKLEFTSTYTIYEETSEHIIYEMNVHILNAKLRDIDVHIGSIEVTDFSGNTYYPLENSKKTTVDVIPATESVDLDFYIQMPAGEKPRDVYFFDTDGNYLDELTFDYDDKE